VKENPKGIGEVKKALQIEMALFADIVVIPR
jgi:hypothetical protein